MNPKVHPTAIIEDGAEIHPTVEVGPHVIIEAGVKVGAHTRVMAGAYLCRGTQIGEKNQIHMGAVLGHVPQDLSFDPATVSYLQIGNHNIIREYVTLHRGSKPEGKTVIGNHNFLMAYAHIGHDSHLGNHVILANGATLGGHVVVGDHSFISAHVVIHQFVRVGRFVMISGGARISRNIPPFMMALERNLIGAINLVGLRRGGVSREAIREIKKAYILYFCSGKTKTEAIKAIETGAFASQEAGEFLAYVRASNRPIAFHRSKTEEAEDE